MSHKLNIGMVLLLLTCTVMISQCSPVNPPVAPATKDGSINAV